MSDTGRTPTVGCPACGWVSGHKPDCPTLPGRSTTLKCVLCHKRFPAEDFADHDCPFMEPVKGRGASLTPEPARGLDPGMETTTAPCMSVGCTNTLTVLVDGIGLALCSDCREAIWGDTDPHYEDEPVVHHPACAKYGDDSGCDACNR